MTGPARRLPLALALALGLAVGIGPIALAGCRMGIDRAGDDRFLAAELPEPGSGATAADVAASLGPPDEIRIVGDEMHFTYRYREVRETSLVLRYYLDVVKRSDRHGVESTLILSFDRNDRLRHVARKLDTPRWGPRTVRAP